jgi:hypothetical protein
MIVCFIVIPAVILAKWGSAVDAGVNMFLKAYYFRYFLSFKTILKITTLKMNYE